MGKNLQDRYEVSVISEVKRPFKTLTGATLVPENPADPGYPQDPALREWLETGGGLYATNGGAVAFLARSGHHDGPEADLFVFACRRLPRFLLGLVEASAQPELVTPATLPRQRTSDW